MLSNPPASYPSDSSSGSPGSPSTIRQRTSATLSTPIAPSSMNTPQAIAPAGAKSPPLEHEQMPQHWRNMPGKTLFYKLQALPFFGLCMVATGRRSLQKFWDACQDDEKYKEEQSRIAELLRTISIVVRLHRAVTPACLAEGCIGDIAAFGPCYLYFDYPTAARYLQFQHAGCADLPYCCLRDYARRHYRRLCRFVRDSVLLTRKDARRGCMLRYYQT
jgi:hypothetical protein